MFELTDDQAAMLAKLQAVGPASCERLAVLTGFDSTRCSALCSQLVRKGLVQIAGGNAMRRLYQADPTLGEPETDEGV